MSCANHAAVEEALLRCARCDGEFCESCIISVRGRSLCPACKDEMIAAIAAGVLDDDAVPASLFIFLRRRFGVDEPLGDIPLRDPIIWAIYVASFFFEPLFLAGSGRSPGKVMTGIRVVATDGSPVRRSQAWLRVAIDAICFLPLMWIIDRPSLTIRYVAVVPFFAMYASALFTRERRCLPDLIAGTRVIRS